MAIAAVSLLIATPVAMWWLIGDRTEVPAELDPDYVVRPPAIDPLVERAAGLGCALTVVVGLLLAGWVTLRVPGHRPWWSVILSVLTAGYIVGIGLRAMTTGVIGANIGFGVMVLWGGPAVVMLLMWAVVRAIELLRQGVASADGR
jgi:hypothetical protein